MASLTVLLDLDGTLVDSEPGILSSVRAALQALGHAPDPSLDISEIIGPPIEDVMGLLLARYGDDRIAEAVPAYREDYGRQGLFASAPYAGVPEALTALRAAGARLILATSKRRAFAQKILAHLGLESLFTAVHGSEPGGALDHKPELIAHILARHGLAAAGCVMVGDRRYDIAGAHANGVRALGVLWGYGAREELESAGADDLVAEPQDLPAAVLAMAQAAAPPLPGLPRGKVFLAPYDARWSGLFAEEAARVAAVLGGAALAIEHYGSTSIPGIVAKPVIDLLIGLRTLDEALEHRAAMEALGYDYASHAGVAGHHVFGRGVARTHLAHFVEYGGAEWRACLAFRDALRADPRKARDYEALKLDLAARHPDDRAAYTAGKSAFVAGVLSAS